MVGREGNERVDFLVRGFGRLLDVAWPEVTQAASLDTTDSFLLDWLQANWEMFVEAGLAPGTFLEVYGEGADCNLGSSRVYRPDVLPTHVVVCLPRSGLKPLTDVLGGELIEIDGAGVRFGELVSVEGSWYARKPPFDCILVEPKGKTHLLRLSDVMLALRPSSSE